MRVLYLLPEGERGGAERAVEMWIAAHSPDIHPLVVLPEGPLAATFRQAGVRVHTPPHYRMARLPEAILDLRNLVRDESIDIIHSTMPKSHLFGSILAQITGKPEIWFSHGPIGNGYWQGLLPLLPSSAMLVNSRFMYEKHRKSLYNAKSLRIQRLGLDTSKLTPSPTARAELRERYKLADDHLVIGMFGRITRWKGQHILLKAIHMLREAGELKDVKCLMVGGNQFGLDHEYRAELARMSAELGLDDVVVMTGHIDNVYDYYDLVDVVVHTSTTPEPFGLVVAEAMAKGKVVIATKEGGPGEMVEHAATGLLYPAGSVSGLAAMLRQYLSMSTKERSDVGLAARESISANHDIALSVRQLEELYQEIVSKHQSMRSSARGR
jgi:glycosyltransferase involved in cell wall biosynthesis